MQEAWTGWHAIAKPMRKDFTRYVELANKGARELGFADNGAMWRSKYDMPPDAFAKEVDRLWEQVKPLYLSLHAYVREPLREKYGDIVPATGPIPAHLLGEHVGAGVGEHLSPGRARECGSGLRSDRDSQEAKHRLQADGALRRTLLHVARIRALPQTFWERSMFIKPRDREVVCHASAWDVDTVEDLRLKMCIEITADDFVTIHHELGHNFYQRAYNKQPFLFRDSANDGFHEALGDTIALSVTPEYLVKLGLLDRAPDTSKDIGLLLTRRWRRSRFCRLAWSSTSGGGRYSPARFRPRKYNQTWWELRRKYQGIAPPVERSEDRFRPRRQVSTWPRMSPTSATSWPTFCNSSFIARCRRSPAARSRSTAAPSTATRKRASAWTP